MKTFVITIKGDEAEERTDVYEIADALPFYAEECDVIEVGEDLGVAKLAIDNAKDVA